MLIKLRVIEIVKISAMYKEIFKNPETFRLVFKFSLNYTYRFKFYVPSVQLNGVGESRKNAIGKRTECSCNIL